MTQGSLINHQPDHGVRVVSALNKSVTFILTGQVIEHDEELLAL